MSLRQANCNLYNEVRSGFIRRGTTLNAWCKAQRFTRQYVEKCLKYQRNGPSAYAIRIEVATAAGLCFAQEGAAA